MRQTHPFLKLLPCLLLLACFEACGSDEKPELPLPDADASTPGLSCGSTQRACGGQCVVCPNIGVSDVACAEERCTASACREGFSPCASGCCPDLWDGEGTASPVDAELTQNATAHGPHPSLGVDAQSRPHLVYRYDVQASANGVAARGLRYAIWSGSEWTAETLASLEGATAGFEAELALGADGVPHVAFARPESGGQTSIVHASRQGQSWQTDVAETAALLGPQVAIALSANGVQLAYRDGTPGSNQRAGLVLATGMGATWNFEVVGPAALTDTSVGGSSAIALDPQGTPWVMYEARTLQGLSLRQSRFTEGSWNAADVDASLTTGTGYLYPSLAIDSAGRPHVAYSDPAAGDLKYAYWTGSEWKIESIDVQGDTGWGPSLALDAQDRPHIAYLDRSAGGANNAALRYAYFKGDGWELRTVVPSGAVAVSTGAWTALALDARGRIHLAYAGANGQVRYLVTR